MRLVVVDVDNTSTAVGIWSDGRVSHVAHCDGGFAEACKAEGENSAAMRIAVPPLREVSYGLRQAVWPGSRTT